MSAKNYMVIVENDKGEVTMPANVYVGGFKESKKDAQRRATSIVQSNPSTAAHVVEHIMTVNNT